jgi:hypothetical protein
LPCWVHGTTRCRPGEVLTAEEAPKLKPLPDDVFDIPTWTHPKVARIGTCRSARRGQLIKVQLVVGPGRRHTDPADLRAEVSAYAMRDLNALQHKASAHGNHVGVYAAAVLEHPLPCKKMRQVYQLLG